MDKISPNTSAQFVPTHLDIVVHPQGGFSVGFRNDHQSFDMRMIDAVEPGYVGKPLIWVMAGESLAAIRAANTAWFDWRCRCIFRAKRGRK